MNLNSDIRSMNQLKEQISRKSNLMTPMQKRIADYMIEHPERFALKSIREIAKELSTSKSSIVRLSQMLGFKGFYELKSFFLKDLSDGLDPLYRYKQLLSTQHQGVDYLETIAVETLTNVHATMSVVNQDEFSKAVEIIKESKGLYTIGRGISSYMADLSSYLMGRLGLHTHSLVHSGFTFAEQLVTARKKESVLAFSFPPYTQETIMAAQYAKERGLMVITVTDKLTNKIVQYSDANIQVVVESSTISNSMSGVLYILYALSSTVGRELKKKTLHAIKSIEHIRKEHSQ